MKGLYEVDPSGDVIIILRNPGAPFAEAAPEAEPTNEGPVAADTVGIEFRSTGKKNKGKKRKLSRSSCTPVPCVSGYASPKLNPSSKQKPLQ